MLKTYTYIGRDHLLCILNTGHCSCCIMNELKESCGLCHSTGRCCCASLAARNTSERFLLSAWINNAQRSKFLENIKQCLFFL